MAVTIHAVRDAVRTMAALVLLAISILPAVAAQEPVAPRLSFTNGEGVQPGVFEAIAGPGETTTIPMQLRAAGSDPVAARIRVANVASGVNGGVLIVEPEVPLATPATWIEIATGPVTLEVGEGVDRPVTVRVPESATPGLHVAAVVAQTVEPAPIPGSDASQVVSVTAMIAILVPGEAGARFDLEAATVVQQGRGMVIRVEVANTGAVPVSPAGTLTLADANGDKVADIPVRMGAVFAGTSTVLDVPLPPALAAGTYTLTLDLEDADTGATAGIDDGSLEVPAEG